MLSHYLSSSEKEEERCNQKLQQRQIIWTMNSVCLDIKIYAHTLFLSLSTYVSVYFQYQQNGSRNIRDGRRMLDNILTF